jgi:aspartate ammonia-lyase
MHTFVHYSSCMKGLAITLSKICHDLRLLSSDPQPAGRAITPPPGAFNMPGETNPTISPVAARIFEAQTMLIEAIDTLRVSCVDGIVATPEVHQRHADDRIATTRPSAQRSRSARRAS